MGYLLVIPLLKYSIINHSKGIWVNMLLEYPAVLLEMIILFINIYKSLDDSKENMKRMLSLSLGFMVLYDIIGYVIVLFLFSRYVALCSKLISIFCIAAILFIVYKFLYKKNYKKVSYVIFGLVLLLFPGVILIIF